MLNDGAKLRQQVFSCMVFILSNFCNMNFDRLPFEIGLLKLSDSFFVLLIFEFFTRGKNSLARFKLA